MLDLLIKAVLGGLLLLTAIQDIRNKSISTWILLSGLVLVVIGVPFTSSLSLLDRGLGLLTGLSVMGISKATGGKIGMGDGMLLCISGIGLGFWNNIELFAIGLFLAAIVSIVLLIMKKVNRKHSIPFVPFLFMGYLIIFMISKPWAGLF